MDPKDEFVDLDLTEDEIDAMMARSEPAELTAPPRRLAVLDVTVRSTPSRTYGSEAYVRRIGRAPKSTHGAAKVAILT